MKLHFEPNLLLSTSNKRGTFTAQVELDFQRGAHVRRETATVQPGEDLDQKTQRAVYADCLVQNIGCKAGGMSPESQPGWVPRNGQMPR